MFPVVSVTLHGGCGDGGEGVGVVVVVVVVEVFVVVVVVSVVVGYWWFSKGSNPKEKKAASFRTLSKSGLKHNQKSDCQSRQHSRKLGAAPITFK